MSRPAHPHQLPCGQWPSPIDAAGLAAAALRLSSPSFTSKGALLWLEGRPAQGGRTVLVHAGAGGALPAQDFTPPPLDVRSRVHEYGGGAYTVLGEEVVFVDSRTSVLYRQRLRQPPQVLTEAGADWRFGDLTADPARGRILAVAERHQPDRPPENFVVAVDACTGAIDRLLAGADFYASPTPSPDGAQLAWISWMHPHLPWDAGEIHLAELDAAGRPRDARRIAGDASGSAQQPRFAADGTLYFLLEAKHGQDARWNLHRWRKGQHQEPEPPEPDRCELVADMPTAELGPPPWQLGVRTWDFIDESTVLAAAVHDGRTSLVEIDLQTREVTWLPVALASVVHLATHAGQVVLHAGLADGPGGILTFTWSRAAREAPAPRLLRASLPMTLDRGWVAQAEALDFPTSAGDVAHGFFYAPRNPKAAARPGERPPLIVMVHGGPTASATPSFSPLVQFWTTRGLAVLDVNYRGSSGYGRAFRDRLRGQWGVFDVDDCIAGVRALIAADRVDANRIAIRGGSAGGFTVLAALTRAGNPFHAGASLYGVSDLAALAAETHKFESRYLDALVGPWPERADLYAARSPISHPERVSCPVIFFQGLDDKVVPPYQTEKFVEVLREKNLPVEMHTFAHEQHGFRRAETLETVFRAELNFYGRIFGFQPQA